VIGLAGGEATMTTLPRSTLLAGVLLLGLCHAPAVRGQAALPLDSLATHLPLVVIDTRGVEIPDEPKIVADFGIVDNGPGMLNRVADPFTGHAGPIGIERRGSSSQSFPKLSYGFETWDEVLMDVSVSLFGFPEEEDWILYGPYSDKSLLRNVLIFHLSNRLGRYGSRTRFVELVLNGEYQGVYVAMEKVKRDANRVDIANLRPDETSGDDLTGGYIIKIDKWTGSSNDGWSSPHLPRVGLDHRVTYQYDEPKGDELTSEQRDYIQRVIAAFEDTMSGVDFADPETGYASLIDVDAAVDFILLNEISRNVDGYRLSTFLHKDKDSNGGKLVFGPLWDFNLAFGNADYYNGGEPIGFQIETTLPDFDGFQPPFWWEKLWREPAMHARILARWEALRRSTLRTDSLHRFIDAQVTLLGDAAQRNFDRWPVLGTYVWPNRYVGPTYLSEINYLKDWIDSRLDWMDAALPNVRTLQIDLVGSSEVLVGPYPNPVRGDATLALAVPRAQRVEVALYDALGRHVRIVADEVLEAGRLSTWTVACDGLAAGVYLLRIRGNTFTQTRRLAVVR
jgi:hypothetical protein